MSKPLHVRIEFLGQGLEFILEIDKPFLIGRSDEVQVFIEDDSVSVQHLELLWDGALLRVRDLDSSNGSFRMPQDGPFLEAFFGPQDRELHLRLAKVPVTLFWSDPSPSSEEKTEIAGMPKPPPKIEAPTVEPLSVPPNEAPLKMIETPKPKPAPDPERREVPELSPQKASNWPRALFVAGALAAAIQNYYFFSRNRFVLSQNLPWSLGRATDAYVLWWEDFTFFAQIWGASALAVVVLKLRLPPPKSGRAGTALGSFGVLLLVSVFAWPLFFLRQSGHPPTELRRALTELRQMGDVVKRHDFSKPEKNLEISSRLGELTEPLQGSSVFYAIWHNFQKKRVIQECGGTGERSWEKKRTCLVLLFTLSVDGYTSIHPSLLGATASSLVFLSSLDGVIRVLAAEGVESEHVALFLNSLQEIGLRQEAVEFTALVQSYKGRGFDDLLRALLELRQNLERKIYESQNSASLPTSLKLNLMGPLEMGI